MLQSLANEWGLLDQATYDVIVGIDNLASSVEDGSMSVDTMEAAILRLTNRIQEVPTDIGVNFRINVMGEIPGEISGRAEDRNVPYQHGGTLGGGSFLAGEHGPELIRGIRGGGQVVSAPTTARMMGQQHSVQNNYNLTTNSLTRPGGLALEFAAMEMGSR